MFLFGGISSATDALILPISVFLALIPVLDFLTMLFEPLSEINTTHMTLLAELVKIPSIIFVILFVFSALIRKLIGKKSILTQFKCFSLIGYAGIALCGIVPRLLIFFYFVGKEKEILDYIALISSLTSVLIYFTILRPNSKLFKVDYFFDGTKSLLWKQFLLHIIVFIVTIRIAIALFEDEYDRGVNIICVPSMFDFCQVLRGAVILKEKDNQKQTLVTGNVEISKDTRVPEPENKLNRKMFLFGDISSAMSVLILPISAFLALIPVLDFLTMLFEPLFEIYAKRRLTLLAELVKIPSIIFVILYTISTLIRKLVRKKSILTQFKCFSLIGYGGIALCSIVPRILIFFYIDDEEHPKNDNYMLDYIALISCVTTILIYFIILRPNSKHFKVNYDLDGTKSWFWKLVLLHMIVFIVPIRIAFALFEDEYDRFVIISCQLAYSFFCVPSMFDFCQVLRKGGVILKAKDNQSGDNQKQTLVTGNVQISKETIVPELENGSKSVAKIFDLIMTKNGPEKKIGF